ncbi:DegT/DnrJ/EryC1/StrS family aminotransferase [Paraburkholderia metrosideri]|uniref:dTDP-4-amino-4,6-dideoxy-D-glucose transaminase n=1 Tax=Paraburkholderia metrosideri TaxID=580937 RepID=A0ABM8NRQ0_9BURK|nr:DegT/DnrJ/EryC1/StrS family aminotransferase [Paraburkholderia metrosideri]CAD6540169.1 dTDP-4-amino-4,6-dideoxy-D-glucose transaminase [Paraburkholderia metrosideri]
MDKLIPVTQPFLPPLEAFLPYLEQIWESKQVTNGGPFHTQLEAALCDYLGVEYLSLFSNGTLALITALQAMKVTGEVITTPFSFVATTHALHWNGIRPVFADIDPVSLNLDPQKIEAAITPQTTAILPVHVYGNPCEVEAIERIADIYGLRVLYDAAHAFGVRKNGQSVLNFGDMSVLSFHGTKIFNTFEGGAIICRDAKTKRHIDHLKNFGFADEVTVVRPGINAKMNEVQSAFGMLQLQYVDQIALARAQIADRYRSAFRGVEGLLMHEVPAHSTRNNSYFPVRITDDFPVTRDELYDRLRTASILARRYFYPLISEFPSYRGLPSAGAANLPIATEISRQILCLPIYPALDIQSQQRVIDVVLAASGVAQASAALTQTAEFPPVEAV